MLNAASGAAAHDRWMQKDRPAGAARPPAPPAPVADNRTLAQSLREMAALLQAQGDNPFRVGACRRAANTVARWAQPVHDVFAHGGLAALDALPGIGPHIAAALAEQLSTGHWTQLERLRGSSAPEWALCALPGVGPTLAHRLHDELGVDTLEGLSVVAREGRLDLIPGIGPRRAAALEAALAERLQRQRRTGGRWRPAPPGTEPPVELLLAVDQEYRHQAQAGRLPQITARRRPPGGATELPVLHTQRPGWHLTALYGPSARADAPHPVRDAVLLYAEDDQHHERPYTVVTAWRGALLGRRVVRGREDECSRWYALQATLPPPTVLARP